jgi:hypothetical protein
LLTKKSKDVKLKLNKYSRVSLRENPSRQVSLQFLVEGGGGLPPDHLFYFFSFVLYFLSLFCFGPALSHGLLIFFPLGGSLRNQEVNVIFSNPYEDLEFVGFNLLLG